MGFLFLAVAIVGLLWGVVTRLASLHIQERQIIISLYNFTTLCLYQVAWIIASADPYAHVWVRAPFLGFAAAAEMGAAMWLGKTALSTYIHNVLNRRTVAHLRLQIEVERAKRQKDHTHASPD